MSAHGWAWRYGDSPVYLATVSLVESLQAAGIPDAALYQDGTSGGMLCVRIPLRLDDAHESMRALYVLTEDDEEPRHWYGQITAWEDEDGSTYEECTDVIDLDGTETAAVVEAIADVYAQEVEQ
jgi:hypothetical protein